MVATRITRNCGRCPERVILQHGSAEQLCLRPITFELVEITQANTHESKELFRTQIHFCSQRKSDVGQLLARRRRRRWCVTAGENLELARLEFEDYRPGYPR